MKLYDHWNLLSKQLGANPEKSKQVWDEICEAYANYDRHYHTIFHLSAMFKELDSFISPNKPIDHCCFHYEKLAIRLAIFFHDYIYDTKSHTNEHDSWLACLGALDFMECNFSEIKNKNIFLMEVRNMILATKNHIDAKDVSFATCVLLDLDLAILGANKKEFEDYCHAIREEYCWVDNDLYRQVRSELLNIFLAQKNIFKLPSSKYRWEEKARTNLKNAIAELS